jgi:hypothetical protein
MSLAERRALDMLTQLAGEQDNPVTSAAILESFWALMEGAFVPKPNLSERHGLRYQHVDLRTLDTRELWIETQRAEMLTVWCADLTGWIADRLMACRAEAERRAKKQ